MNSNVLEKTWKESSIGSDGPFTLNFPGMKAGEAYTVRLHLREIATDFRNRKYFSVVANGAIALTSLEIEASEKSNVSTVAFPAHADSSGQVKLVFSAGVSKKQIHGIEIVPGLQVPPNPPERVRAFCGNRQVKIAWSPVIDAISYTIKRRTPNGRFYHPVAVGIKGTSYVDLGVSRDEMPVYVVSSVNYRGESRNSSETAPAAPYSLSVLPEEIVLTRGSSSSAQITAAFSQGFLEPLDISISGKIGGLTTHLETTTLLPERPDNEDDQVTGTIRISFSADYSMERGAHTLVIMGRSGDYSTAAKVPLFIK